MGKNEQELLTAEAREAIRSYILKMAILPGSILSVAVFIFGFLVNDVMDSKSEASSSRAYAEAIALASERIQTLTEKTTESRVVAENAKSQILLSQQVVRDIVVDANKQKDAANALLERIKDNEKLSASINDQEKVASIVSDSLGKNIQFMRTLASNANLLPIGTILPWHKSFEGTPSLPEQWIELNGQRVKDTESPYHNSLAPNLNDQVYANSRGFYLRGGTESGLLNESSYYSDNGYRYGGEVRDVNEKTYYGASYGSWNSLDNVEAKLSSYAVNTPLGSQYRVQVAAMSVVWIMKIK